MARAITVLLQAADGGDAAAKERLFALLYDDLTAMARARLRGSAPNTLLDTGSLVHESFLRLSRAGELEVTDRARFLGYVSRTMRSVVVDFARKRYAARRGGDLDRVTLSTDIAETEAKADEELFAIHEALAELEKVEPRLARLVEMRYFAGLPLPEIAEALGVSERTLERDWRKARAILYAAVK